jgi:hypothetical protein
MSLILMSEDGEIIKISKEEEEYISEIVVSLTKLFEEVISEVCREYKVIAIALDIINRVGYIYYVCDGDEYVYVSDLIANKYVVYRITPTLTIEEEGIIEERFGVDRVNN